LRVLRILGIVLAAAVALAAGVTVAARFADGPVGPFPGGPLESGPLHEEPVEDWSFARDVGEVELQLLDPPRSRTTWIVVHEGRAYIPCGIPGFRLWKQWPHEALEDPRALVRVEGRRYRVDLERVEDPELQRALRAAVAEKYPAPEGAGTEVWYFALRRPGDGPGAEGG